MNVTQSEPLTAIKPILPPQIRGSLERLDMETQFKITEIRIRENGACTLTLDGENCVLTSSGITKNTAQSIKTSKDELDAFIFRLCRGSVYSYEPSLKEGFVTRNGIRVGISGTVTSKNGQTEGFSRISGVNIRLPRHIPMCSSGILDYISENGFPDGKGILVVSPPGAGKTTVLRDLAANLSRGISIKQKKVFFRVCVIDERSEIYIEEAFCDSACDFLTGISKAKGIEIATRVLSPQIIVCDEISTESEAREILHANSGGVILAASVHADTVESALSKPHIKALFDAGVFGAAYCLERKEAEICGSLTQLFPKRNA